MCYSADGLEVSMADLTVVFEAAVPLLERQRLLNSIGRPAMTDESEAGAYCISVPDDEEMSWAQRYANLEYGDGKPAVSRVSFTRLTEDVEP